MIIFMIMAMTMIAIAGASIFLNMNLADVPSTWSKPLKMKRPPPAALEC